MTAPHERRRSAERRALLERRLSIEREQQRPDDERRVNGDRRAGQERRLAVLSAEDQIHEALRLLTRVIDAGKTAESERRSLEGAMLRLRFALDRLEE
jgi:hypothetical protein